MLNEERPAQLRWQRNENIYTRPDEYGCHSFCADGDGFVSVEFWDGHNKNSDDRVLERGFWILDQGEIVHQCREHCSEQEAINMAEDYMRQHQSALFEHLDGKTRKVARTEDGYVLLQTASGQWINDDFTFDELPEGSRIIIHG